MVRAAYMILEGPMFQSWLGHHFSMVLSSLSDSWYYPCSVESVKEMAAPSEMCWANKELKSPVEEKAGAVVVLLNCPSAMPDNLLKCWFCKMLSLQSYILYFKFLLG